MEDRRSRSSRRTSGAATWAGGVWGAPMPLSDCSPSTPSEGAGSGRAPLGDSMVTTMASGGGRLLIGGDRLGNEHDPDSVARADGGLLRELNPATGRPTSWKP